MLRAAILISLCLASAGTGYLLGFDKGFEWGHKVGMIDQMFESKGMCILHNGRPE